MRKVLIFLFSTISICVFSQVDTTSPYIWVEEEIIDTAKAVAIAKELVASMNTQCQKEIDLLKKLKDNNKKKVKSDEEIKILKDIANRYQKKGEGPSMGFYSIGDDGRFVKLYRAYNYENLDKLLDKGKIHKIFFDSFDDIIADISSNLKDVNTYPYHSFANVVVILPKKKVTVRKDNPNYGFRWLDNFDYSKLKYNPIKEINTSADYPQYIFRYKKINGESSNLAVYDKMGNLVAIKYNTSHDIDKESIMEAGMKYDYEHNAYDIKEESAAIRNALDDWYHDRSVQKRIDALKKKQVGIIMSKRLSQNLLYNMISNSNEYKAAQIVINEYDKKERDLDRQIEGLKKKLPSTDIQRCVDSYLRQLKSDNDKIWGWGQTYYTRIDGLNFILTQKDNTLKVQETYYIDKDTDDLKCKYKVLSK